MMSATELVRNGSFEYPVVTTQQHWNVYDAIDGWTREDVSGPKIEIQRPNLTHLGEMRVPFQGRQYAELDADMVGPAQRRPPHDHGSMGIYQVLDTVPGQSYMLRFAFAGRAGSGHPNILGVAVTDVGTSQHLIYPNLAATTADDLDLTKSPNADWTEYGYVFVAKSSHTKIAFHDRGLDNTKGTFLDDVRVTPANEQDVTELKLEINPDAALNTEQKVMLAMSTGQLKSSGLSAAAQDVRIEVLEAVITGKTELPPGGSFGSRNPKYWKDTEDGYVVASGVAPERAIDDMWDGLVKPHSSLIMLEAYYRHFQDVGNQSGIDALDKLIGNKVIPDDLSNQGNGTLWISKSKQLTRGATGYAPADLLPGDQVWFWNPYFEAGKAIIRQEGAAKGLHGEALDKYVSNQSTGEEGSNVFYLGVGTQGTKDYWNNDANGEGLVVSIYNGRISTLKAYQHFVMTGTGNLKSPRRDPAYDNTVQAVKDDMTKHPERYTGVPAVKEGDFPIMRVRSVLDGSSI